MIRKVRMSDIGCYGFNHLEDLSSLVIHELTNGRSVCRVHCSPWFWKSVAEQAGRSNHPFAIRSPEGPGGAAVIEIGIAGRTVALHGCLLGSSEDVEVG